jgi:hypothetical protein
MNKGINIGQFRGVNIVDYTHAFDVKFFRKYIEEALTAAPEEHLKAVENINIYDECPSNAPVVAMGGYYPPETKKGAALDIYLDQNFGHLLSDSPKRKLSRFFDALFIRSFGKYFMIHTILHELGHHVYQMTVTPESKDDNEASEKYAEEYANEIYNKKYRLQHKYYQLFNGLYHLLYWRRIIKDDRIRQGKKDGLTTQSSRQ